MIIVPGRRQSHGSRLQRLPQRVLHPGQVVLASGLAKRSLPHGPGSQGRVTYVAGVVYALRPLVDGIQILREGFPGPVDARCQRLARHILRPLKVTDDQLLLPRLNWSYSKSAIAHHDCRDTVITRTRASGVPHDLGVHVGMAINKSRTHYLSGGVNLTARRTDIGSDRNYDVAIDCHISQLAVTARPIYNQPIFNDQIVHSNSPLRAGNTAGLRPATSVPERPHRRRPNSDTPPWAKIDVFLKQSATRSPAAWRCRTPPRARSPRSQDASVRLLPSCRRSAPVTPSAAMSTTPVKADCSHSDAPTRLRPVVPTPSKITARIVPPALKRPSVNCVAPRKTAANAGRRYGLPPAGEPAAIILA